MASRTFYAKSLFVVKSTVCTSQPPTIGSSSWNDSINVMFNFILKNLKKFFISKLNFT